MWNSDMLTTISTPQRTSYRLIIYYRPTPTRIEIKRHVRSELLATVFSL